MDTSSQGDAQGPQAGSDRPKAMPRSLVPRETRSGARRPGRHPDNAESNRRLMEEYLARRDAAEGSGMRGDDSKRQSEDPSERRKRERSDDVEAPERPERKESGAPEQRKRTKRPIPQDWKAPLAIGESLGENLSRVEEAERLVLQWEAILKNARETQPFANFSGLEKRLDEARRERDELEETEETLTPFEELDSTKREKIADRLELLEEILQRNKSPDGEVNINAAIAGYKDGSIQCWDKWTLIYAGHIVDFCPTYESFTEDREERMDRYFEVLGGGWLWFEPPLAPGAAAEPDHLFAATWAQPSTLRPAALATDWFITMGFRQVQAFHRRVEVPETASKPSPDPWTEVPSDGKVLNYMPKNTRFSREELRTMRWMLYDDPAAPRFFFKMHLDSGASHPMLMEKDFEVLNITPETYPPQSAMNINTVNGNIRSQAYEVRVDVCQHNGESLVGENPVWPNERHELGGIVLVLSKPGESPPDASEPLSRKILRARWERGEDVSEDTLAKRSTAPYEVRLSGLLPFKVCYSACAPGMQLWFGEDRRDVIGMDRMPGQRRFEAHKQPRCHESPVDLQTVGRPKRIAFEHEIEADKRIIDRDVRGHPGASVIRMIDGPAVNEFRWEPRKLESQRLRKVRQEVKAKKDKSFLRAFRRLVSKGEDSKKEDSKEEDPKNQ